MALSLDSRRRKGDEGFTLIELLIVIIILGILAAIVVFSVRGITDNGEEAACKTEFRTVDTAIEAYYAADPDNDGTLEYPATLADLVSGGFLHSVPTDYVTGITAATATTPAKASGATC